MVAALPGGIQAAAPWVRVTISYLLVVAATLAWRELSLGRLRLLLDAIVAAGLLIGLAGIGTFLLKGDTDAFLPANALLAALGLLTLVAAVALPEGLARGYIVLPHRGVLAAGTLSIENELAVARRLQLSILPTATPDLRGARVAAVYEPMTAVAGVAELRSRPAEEASRALLAAVRAWVPPSVPQQDDITVLLIDLTP